MQKKKNHRILQYLFPCRRLVFFAALLMMAEVALNVWQPKLMAEIIDDGVLLSDMQVILRSGMLMLLVAFFGAVTGYTSCVLSNIYAQRFGNSLRKALFGRAMRLSAEQLGQYTEGTLITRITADTRVLSEFSAVLIQTLVKPLLLFVFGSVMVFTINPSFGWIVLMAVPVQLLFMLLFIRKSAPMFRSVQQKLDRISTLALQLVRSNRLIKAYGREDYEAERFGEANRSLMQTNLQVQQLMAIMNPLILLLLNGVMMLILYVGGLQAEAGTGHVGQVMAAISYSQQIMMSLMMAGMVFQFIARSRASAERVDEILRLEPKPDGGEYAGEGPVSELELDGVSFRYPGSEDDRFVLRDVSLCFRRGQRTLIIGATGSGKSTLSQLLTRRYDPSAGEIRLDGHALAEWSGEALRDKISYVFQDSDFFSGTVADNIRFGTRGECSDEQLRRAAETAQALEFITSFKNGFQERVSERGLSLSGGQRQRVAIARALLRRPEVLVMDDSTSNLDAETEKRLFAALREAGIPIVIVIAQRLTGLLDAEQIVLLHEGRVEAVGTHAELLRQSDRYRAIYASQCTEGGDADA